MKWKQRLKRAQLSNRSVSINQNIEIEESESTEINTVTQIAGKRKGFYLAGPSEGRRPRNDEAELGLFIEDLSMETAGLEKDRNREAIIADNETDAMHGEVGILG